MRETIYFDNPEEFDWEKEELLYSLSFYDKVHRITCSLTIEGIIYDLEAIGTHSTDKLVTVLDIKILNAESVGLEPENN